MPLRPSHALVAFGLVSAAGACDTSAVGVDECRSIEKARCVAGRSCDLGIDSDKDEATCERFARDNCLHGLALSDTPKSSDVDRCVSVIRGAGACAAKKTTLAKDCSAIGTVSPADAKVCDIIQDPEEASACQFLVPDKTTPTPSSTASSDAGHD